MGSGLRPLIAACLVMAACTSSQPLTQERKLYDDMCARGGNVWRMFYGGTDSVYHHFTVNDMDRWAIVRIAKAEIDLAEPVPYGSAYQGMGHYCVDPCAGWSRVDTCWLKMR